jgi:hypothetical protein
MSLTPEPAAIPAEPEAIPSARQRRRRRWPAFLFGVLTLSIGVFLAVFPWIDSWNLNYIQDLIPGAQNLWDEPSFRGAVTGLGFVNVYIALTQFVRAFRRR